MNLNDSLILKCYNKFVLSRQSEIGKKVEKQINGTKQSPQKDPYLDD